MEIDAVNPVAEQTAPVGMSEQSDTINAADLYTSEANDASVQTDANVQTDAPVQEPEERRYTSGEMSDTVRKRLDKEHRKAAWVLGSELLQERMQAENIDEAEALKRIRDERIKAKAARFKEDPEGAIEELYRMRNTQQEPEDTPTSDGDVQRVFNEITQEIRDGKVPQGFDLVGYLSEPARAREFLELRETFGIERACSMAMRMAAPQPQMTKTEINRALPQSRGTNNAYNPKKLDYSEMSSDDFRAIDAKIKKMVASGKRVEF